ncbi:MAG: 3-phosphoshikimate 1-carboxyvinyltransferase [Candidatus Caenarcaniphilales bacterium]|nr:3-phosphoshikimate 1-carboxyvinyltransferase [Candidatus Caenarcaniphilales bacterium]
MNSNKKLEPVKKNGCLSGEVFVPPDKSIAQRAAILSSIAEGESLIKNFPNSGDPQTTLRVIQQLGVKIEDKSWTQEGNLNLVIKGNGTHGLTEPTDVLNCGNSGTCLRFMLGVLASNPNIKYTVMSGDQSLRKRPMKRVVAPLKELGANILGRNDNRLAPLTVVGKELNGGFIENKIASAQLKSALLLAGLNAKNSLTIEEPAISRNHTEIMLASYGANIQRISDLSVQVLPSSLMGCEVVIPGDISCAAFIITAALLVPNSRVKIRNVGLNPTRTGFLEILQRMGGKLIIKQKNADSTKEIIGDIEASFSEMKGIEIAGSIIPNIIDELPILSLAAAQATGTTIIKGASELRVKESDRLKAMFDLLSKLGVRVIEEEDGLIIEGRGGKPFEPNGDIFYANHDHRIAMTSRIGSLISTKGIELDGSEWADVSFPGFYDTIENLIH